MLHDFPWGLGGADWDVPMTQTDYNLRIAACTQLNTNPKAISFALLSMYDFRMNRDAHIDAGWTGGDIILVIDKTDVVDPTPKSHGLITNLNGAQVCFRTKQSDSIWVFPNSPDERKSRWPALSVKTKTRGEGDAPCNFAEQPVEIDQKAIGHWSEFGDWIFADGFGSGTSLIACFNQRRSCVGTEPDPKQFRIAGQRLDNAIRDALRFDAAAERRKQLKEKQMKESNKLHSKVETQKLRLQRKESKKRRRPASPGSPSQVPIFWD